MIFDPHMRFDIFNLKNFSLHLNVWRENHTGKENFKYICKFLKILFHMLNPIFGIIQILH